MRLIDADALKKDIADNYVFTGFVDLLNDFARAIDGQPTVDSVERKRGRWEMKPDPYGFFDEIPVCSECGCTTKMRETYKFCPNCGAEMERKEE